MVTALIGILLGATGVGMAAAEWLRLRGAQETRRRLRGRLRGREAPAGGREGMGGALREAVTGLTSTLPFVGRQLARGRHRQVTSCNARDLPQMLDVMALGMRAGLGFDQSLALYARRFDTALARTCRASLEVWERGLVSREDGLRELARSLDSPFFTRFTSVSLRALRFGAPLTQLLLELAREARSEYRAQRQEEVARAPVKMLIPTGALLLPAMLLLVMGPIILDLMGKMV